MNSIFTTIPEKYQEPDDQTDYPPYGSPEIVGDHADDDGQVIDDLLKANPDVVGPIYPNAPGEPIPPQPKAPSRLFTGTATLLESANAQKLLNADLERTALSIWVTPLETPTSEITITNTGVPQTGPGAFTILAEIPAASLPDGWYYITARVQMSGTTAPADVNNARVAIESNVLYVIPINPGTTGATETTPRLLARIDGTQRLRVSNPGAATGTAVYQATIIAERVPDSMSLTAYSPVYLASDLASLQGPSASALLNVPNSPGVLSLDKHTGELWANLPSGSIIPACQISWMATTK